MLSTKSVRYPEQIVRDIVRVQVLFFVPPATSSPLPIENLSSPSIPVVARCSERARKQHEAVCNAD